MFRTLGEGGSDGATPLPVAATVSISNRAAAKRNEGSASAPIEGLRFNDCLNPFFPDRLDECPVVSLVLIGILDCKFTNRVVKDLT